MSKSKDKVAAAYRRQAMQCREVAERMSMGTDRTRMMKMAQHLLDLAAQAEGAKSHR